LLFREHTWELAGALEKFEEASLEKKLRMHVRFSLEPLQPYNLFPGNAKWSGKSEDKKAALSFDMCELVLIQTYDMLRALIIGKSPRLWRS